MKKKELLWLVLIALLAFSGAAAHEGPYHLKLLAVQEENGGYNGSGADLYLELREGTGRVFLETTPLTKMDTQVSTRFAKEIACKHFKLNCDQYDFSYTIKAESNIIGGPSAGAAIAALTTVAVLDLQHNEDIAVTGTINSGGIIGHVGGVKEKLDAAAAIGLKKVLVAKGTIVQSSPLIHADMNSTVEERFNLTRYAQENLSLGLAEVIALDDVIRELTGRELNQKPLTITEDEHYTAIMKSLQKLLCERTAKIERELAEEEVRLTANSTSKVAERKSSAANATAKNDYYSAASFCFANNILLKAEYYRQKEPSWGALANLFSVLERKNNLLSSQVNAEEITTIADLQTLMIVKERLNDVQTQIAAFKEQQSTDLSLEEQYNLLAYAEERYFSALSWQQFFAMEGREFVLNTEMLRNSCEQKISESEERYQYVTLFLPSLAVSGIREKMAAAEKARDAGDYPLCLITAAQAKGDANAIMGSLGLSEENIPDFIASKSAAVQRVIAENSAEGIFPILGYSYYRYADSLKETEKYTALVYLEYALEMSDLSIYFPEEEETKKLFVMVPREWLWTGGGVIGGMILTLLTLFFITFIKKRKKRATKRKQMPKRLYSQQ